MDTTEELKEILIDIEHWTSVHHERMEDLRKRNLPLSGEIDDFQQYITAKLPKAQEIASTLEITLDPQEPWNIIGSL